MSFVNDLFKSATVDKELDSLFAKSKGPAKAPVVATPLTIPTTRPSQKKPVPKATPAPPPAKSTKLAKPAKRAAPESDSEDDNVASNESDSDSDPGSGDEEENKAGSDGEDGEGASSEADAEGEGDTTASSTDAAATKKSLSEKQMEREKLQRTVFVGNVTISASEKEIYKAFRSKFAEHGHVESIRFRSITFTDALPRKLNFKLKNFHPERDSCNAYVVFSTAEAAKKAAASVNATVFEGKHLRCDYLGKTDGSEGRVGARRDVKRCVFVGNVPFDVEDEALWTFFSQAGDVESVRVIRDKKVGLGKGFAYVQFKERSTVPLALKLHETDFKGKPIRVFKCHKIDDNNTTAQSGKPSAASKPKKGGKSSDDKQPPKKKAKTAANESNSLASSSSGKKRKNRARTSEWKKGHEQKKRKAAKELPRKLAKKAKKLATQPGKK